MSAPLSQTARLGIGVADDQMCAWLEVPQNLSAEALTAEAINAALDAYQIQATDAVRQRVAEIAANPEAALAGMDKGRILLVRGKPATEPAPEYFKWAETHLAEETPDPDDNDRINFFKIQHIRTFDEGTDLGVIVPAVPGKAGYNIRGEEIRPKEQAAGQKVQLENGLKRLANPDGDHVITTVAGRVLERDDRMWMDEVMAVAGDVDFNAGSIDSKVAVDIEGAIRANFSVSTPKSMIVHGTIEAADVEIGGDVTCLKGIVGQPDKGIVHAGGTIVARFINDAHVQADGDIRAQRSVLNSIIASQSEIRVDNGVLVGGHTFAREKLVAKSIGSNAAVHTEVVIGYTPLVVAQYRLLDEAIRTIEQGNGKLNPKAISFISRLKQSDEEMHSGGGASGKTYDVAELKAARTRIIETAKPKGQPSVVVYDRIHPGVSLIFGHREVCFKTDLLGPVSISERKVKGAMYIVAVNLNSGSVTPLKMREVDLTPYVAQAAGESSHVGS